MRLFVNRQSELKLIEEFFNTLLDRKLLLRTPTPIIELQGIGKSSLSEQVEQRCLNIQFPRICVDISQICLHIIFDTISQVVRYRQDMDNETNENSLNVSSTDIEPPKRRVLAAHSNIEKHLFYYVKMHNQIVGDSPAFERELLHSDIEIPHADMLVVTSTLIETQAVLQAFYKFCKYKYKCYSKGTKTYFDLGVVNGMRIFLVQSGMGIYGSDGSLLTVQEAIQKLEPSCIVMTGIAFGVDPHKQRIGDIVVAEKVVDYETLRWGTASDGTPQIIWRGESYNSSAKLLDRLRICSLEWPGQSNRNRQGHFGKYVHFGPILSGQKLVDNIDFRNQLISLVPSAACGDMESFGVYVAAQNAKIDCITVKSISDFADGNKSIYKKMGKISAENQDQKTAAGNAIDYLIHALRTTKFV